MIHMPRRSVTRFFIPLIDVLLLLFCIFLLLPQFKEEELDKKAQSAFELADTVTSLEYEIDRLTREMKKYDLLPASKEELESLLFEVEQLRKDRKQVVQRTYFQIIDIDGKTGDIFYYDTAKQGQPKLRIETDKDAWALIERHQQEAQGNEVYYFFLYPRPETGFPTLAQERKYKAWFSRIANSLKEPRP
jgi:hypothetical protein